MSYPLQSVSEDSAGGAEQVLWTLEREAARNGYRTTVAACGGSHVAGELLDTGAAVEAVDVFETREAEHSARVLQRCKERRFSLIHDHSGHFFRYAAEIDTPMLVTLHLPRSFYPADTFNNLAPNVYFNCVSERQLDAFRDLPRMLPPVRNGIALDLFRPGSLPRRHLLWLGRICPEKAPHIALDVAARMDIPLVLAGQVYPFSYHQQYFRREIRPRLAKNPISCFIDTPSLDEKLRVLQRARALLITSEAAETSSLVALEAMACGTPVIAYGNGALPEIIRNGETGFVVHTVREMCNAIDAVDEIRSEACRKYVEQNCSAEKMASEYFERYREVLTRASTSAQSAA
ncbi:MAG TPA: glycosyltransferase [Candidatus Acidoferrales bacterium]|nr:glycosyltransferase [Candidatus Acidoferrales bacterium]